MSSSPMVIVVEPPPSRLTASSAPVPHDARALLEAGPHAVAWLPAVYGDEKQVPSGVTPARVRGLRLTPKR